MKIVITGASGTIGTRLVKALAEEGHDLLLVGRSKEKLSALFPNIPNTGYKNFGILCENFDSCIHLAVQNNHVKGPQLPYEVANVDLLKDVVLASHMAKIPQFINISSFLADTTMDTAIKKDDYAQSKKIAEIWLKEYSPLQVVSIKIPAVYSDNTKGKLRFVNFLPPFIRSMALGVIGGMKPIVNIDKLVSRIIESVETRESGEFIVSDDMKENQFFSITKRAMDLTFAVFVIAAFWWLLLAVAVAIKFESQGPIMFAQKRLGMNKKEFVCWKFRTMLVGTQQAATHEIGKASITKMGHILRKSKIDELPQIINIFRGEISLVGPRPCLSTQSELVDARDGLNVFSILPGITGLSQIRNIDMSEPRKLSVSDAEYVHKRSVLMDLSIILKTFTGSGQGDKVKG